MEIFDALIVGAGPAGSTCAQQLHRAGKNVKLFDKKAFPRVKPCAGWITPQVVETLRIDLEDYRRIYTLQPITSFRTGILGRRMIETNYHDPVSFGIRRIEFDDYLLKRSGVEYRHEAIKQIRRVDDCWEINGCYSAPLLVGAGGHFCPVAKYVRTLNNQPLNNQQSDQPTDSPSNAVVVFAQEVEFEMSDSQKANSRLHAEKPELYFCPDLMGYGWCFRKGNFLNVGLGRTEKTDLSKHVTGFCEYLRSHHKLIDDLPSKFLGHAYRLYAQQPPLLYDDGLLLIGDAAGLAFPQSGEGIRPAVESAMLAAQVVLESQDGYSKSELSKYAQRLTERLGEVKPIKPIQWLPAGWLHNIAATVMATQWFARNTVIEDWFLHRNTRSLTI